MCKYQKKKSIGVRKRWIMASALFFSQKLPANVANCFRRRSAREGNGFFFIFHASYWKAFPFSNHFASLWMRKMLCYFTAVFLVQEQETKFSFRSVYNWHKYITFLGHQSPGMALRIAPRSSDQSY